MSRLTAIGRKAESACLNSLTTPRWNTRVVAADVFEEVARLKLETAGYVLCNWGSQLVTALQERDLVDEYVLFVHPAALGSGVPFFRRAVSLQLVDVRRFERGALGLRYLSLTDVATP